ncbi:hypothetical protein TMatcc_009258 [Talaromyces marneffei ATCC 18224]|uniref:Anaphase-promoting complex subunit 6 n=1 Tax=Talaromyces marneffei PM1 TaxID=1077442 RepID=A0A093UR38_TALMA|nr:uncharacterized protein EYB26_008524 [Talaromyces marneffei]QGA20816.1 hypothetical protein EYB26_008524 [Talaromyces marneffei]
MFSRIEQALIDRGHAKKAYHTQNAVKIVEFFYRFRWFQTLWIDEILKLEFQAMALMQAEVADADIVHSLEKRKKVTGNLTKDEEETIEGAQKRLSGYNKVWWHWVAVAHTIVDVVTGTEAPSEGLVWC